MSIVAALLDKARAGRGLTSDNALAAAIGQHRQTISQWRHGDSYPSEDNIAVLAEMAKDDPGQWLVAIKAVRADSGPAARAWAAVAKRLGVAAMSLLVGVLVALPLHADAAAGGFEQGRSMHYAKYWVEPAGAGLALLLVPAAPGAGPAVAWPRERFPSHGGPMKPIPPCWPEDRTKPNPCALAHYARVVDGHNDLTADWLGWKQRGRYLVSPAGDRISPERMKGIVWRLQQEERLSAARNRNASRKAVSQGLVKVVVVDLQDWHAQRFGTRAG